MEGGYEITAHPARCMLEIRLSGFFDPAQAERFAAKKQAAFERLSCEENAHVTLVDVTACFIQPQNVVALFHEMLTDPRFQARRIAFVVGGSLAKLQVRRLLTDRMGEVFDDRRSAESWLLEK